MITMVSKEDLINILKENNLIRYGKFILTDGEVTDYYVDIKYGVTNPKILKAISSILSEKIKETNINKVAGPDLGAIPLAVAVSLELKIPLLMVRKERKCHGTLEIIEGDVNPNDNIVLVEDVTVTGGSILRAIQSIESYGGTVQKVFVVVDRESGAIEFLKSKGIILEPLVSVSELKD